jgi:hypothetical protein
MQAAPYPTSNVQSVPARPQIHWLLALACVVVILAAVGAVLSAAREFALEMAANGKPGSMENHAYTNGDAAHITFTNMSAATLYQCVRGVVTNKAGQSTKSAVVCTGDVKPHSTVVLEAPYTVGEVRDLCSGQAGQFGIKQIDWDRCTFELEPAGSPGIGTP